MQELFGPSLLRALQVIITLFRLYFFNRALQPQCSALSDGVYYPTWTLEGRGERESLLAKAAAALQLDAAFNV